MKNQLFPERIETDRLVLERLCHENVSLEALHDHLTGDGIEDVLEYTLMDPPATLRETRRYISEMESAWREGESATYVVRSVDEDSDATPFAGITSLMVDWDRRTAEPGMFVLKPYWGRGYARERIFPFAHLAFDRLGLEALEITTRADHEQARRAIDRYIDDLGGHYVGVLHNHEAGVRGSDPVDCHRYTVTRAAYFDAVDSSCDEWY